MMTLTRFTGSVGTKCVITPKRHCRYRTRAVRAAPLRFKLRFLKTAAIGRRSICSSRTSRIAVLCQVGRSDHFFYKPNGGMDDEEPFTKDELELAEAIEALEPYDRSAMLSHVSVEAMDAIQKTASGMLGMLPPSQFHIHIRSLRDPLANLVFSSLCTGYALRNAEYRLQLQNSFLDMDVSDDYEEDDEETEPPNEEIRKQLPLSVLEYIHSLESKIESYQEKEESVESDEEKGVPSTNRLLQYVRSMHPDSVNKLSESAGRGVVRAFNLTVKKVVENLHLTQAYPSSAKLLGRLRSALGETEKQRPIPNPSYTSSTFNLSRDNLTDALLWSMLVGYYTKGLECRLALERCVRDKDSKRQSDKAWYLKLGSLFQDEN